MSFSPRDPDRPAGQRDTGGEGGDLGTDPGRYPYESLYRSASGEPVQPLRPSPRHWEPSLRPPEGEHQGFGWLYRPDPALALPALPEPPAPVAPEPVAARVTPAHGPGAGRTARPGAQPVPPRSRSRVGRTLLLVFVALLLAAVTAFVVGAVVTNRVPSLFDSASLFRPALITQSIGLIPVLPA